MTPLHKLPMHRVHQRCSESTRDHRAAEVRTLAQRSAAAAKEIKELIGDSVSKVEDGTRLVDEAGAALVEEAAAAAESMQDQAQALAQAVTIFKLSNRSYRSDTD
jgi:methyl-accepting chemotaxis protein